jgi:hypothetical protein
MWLISILNSVAILIIFYVLYKRKVPVVEKKDSYDAWRDRATGLLRSQKWKRG